MARPIICITTGDPRGIGPEVVKKALATPGLKEKAEFLIFTSTAVDKNNPNACAKASLEFIDQAFNLIKCGKADALVTGPVSKGAINNLPAYPCLSGRQAAGGRAGMKFEGHTEYLARLCGCKKFAMMFVSKKLKVSLVTRHIPLSEVSKAISIKSICDTVELTHNTLKNWFGIKNPKIGVAGLNPHCGEEGLFGREESITIKPAIQKLKAGYGGISGPIPGDTLLHDAYNRKYDAAVCMYHDQALAAFKMIARNEGVNLTLGLPFVRTSPDHGTGFDIARKEKADPGSMREAIKLAVRLAKKRGANLC